MGADVYGWVEIHNEGDEDWDGVIKASHLTYRDYNVFGTLFGIRKDIDKAHVKSIAERRGLPENLSYDLGEELKKWQDIVAPSWISWQELKTVQWNERPPDDWWLVLFKMMEALAKQWGDANVRLVVWFDQE